MEREGLSRGDLLILQAVLAAAGAAVAAYLTYEAYTAFASSVCDINSYFSCRTVGQSSYAWVAGVPTSVIGLAGFVVLFALPLAAFRGVERIGPWPVDTWILLFAIVGGLAGFGLTLIEVFFIQAICILCALGFALDLGILAVALAIRRTT